MAKPMLGGSLVMLAMSFATSAMALSVNGVTEFARVVTVNASTDGVVKAIAVRPGQRVESGELLIELDDSRQRARVDQSEAMVSGLQPDVTISAMELDRAHELYSLDSLSQVDLQNAENKLKRAESKLKSAQAELDIAADDLTRSSVKASFSGTVEAVHVGLGQYVNPAVENYPLVTLIDDRSMSAVANLSAAQWDAGLAGKPATVKVNGKSYKGSVSYISMRPLANSGKDPQYQLVVAFKSNSPLAQGLAATIDVKD